MENLQRLVDLDHADSYNDRAELFATMATVQAAGLDWDGWYSARTCDNATDTQCFPCRDAKSKRCAVDAAEEYFCEHGVNVAQSLKVAAIEYRNQGGPHVNGDGGAPPASASVSAMGGGAGAGKDYRTLAMTTLERLEHCHGQPGGVLSAHEVIDGVEPDRGTETCHVVELMHSYAELFKTFGDLEYLDRLEAAAFNRLPAPYLNGSMWALEYFHETNTIGGCNQFGLPFECCVANGNQGWPKFTHHLYAKSGDGAGIAALLHAPSTLNTTLAGGNSVSIQLVTDYPFGERLQYTIRSTNPFSFSVRIPGWAGGATVAVDGGQRAAAANGTFHVLSGCGGGGPERPTVVDVTLPMAVRVSAAADGSSGGVVVHAGALLFALDMTPDAEPITQDCYFPPNGCYYGSLANRTDWRRALVLDKASPASGGLKVEGIRPLVAGVGPFARSTVPLRIQAKTVRVAPAAWPTVNCTSMEAGCKCVGPVPSAPFQEDAAAGAGAGGCANDHTGALTGGSSFCVRAGDDSVVTLLPFGSTDLRIAVMPAQYV